MDQLTSFMESYASEKNRVESTTAPDSEGTHSSGDPSSFGVSTVRDSNVILGMKSLTEVQKTIHALQDLQLSREDSDDEDDSEYEALMAESRDRSHQLADKSFSKEELEGAVAKNAELLQEIQTYSGEYQQHINGIIETEKVAEFLTRFSMI